MQEYILEVGTKDYAESVYDSNSHWNDKIPPVIKAEGRICFHIMKGDRKKAIKKFTLHKSIVQYKHENGTLDDHGIRRAKHMFGTIQFLIDNM